MIEKMLTKVLIFGLLCNVICTGFRQHIVIQRIPSSDNLVVPTTNAHPDEKTEAKTEISQKYDVVTDAEKRDCGPKIISYKEKIPLLKNMLDNFTALAEKHKLDPADKILIEDERDHVRTMTDDLIAKFDPDLEKLRNMSGESARIDWCAHEMSIYLKMRRNLTLAGKQFKEDVLSILNHTSRFLPTSTAGTAVPHYPQHVRDDFDEALSEIVNWLFIIDLGTNMMVSTGTLLNKLYEYMRTKVNLEKKWTITKEGKVEVPEKAETMYHDDEIRDEGFEKELEKEENEIFDNSIDAAEDDAAEITKLLEEAHEVETNEVEEGVEMEKDFEVAKKSEGLGGVVSKILQVLGKARV